MNKILVVSGPSWVWKDTVIKNILPDFSSNFEKIVTHTTREIRPGEENWKSYNFVSKDAFQNLLENKDIFEHIFLHNNFYGTSNSEIEKVVSKWKVPIANIDPIWFLAFKEKFQKDYKVCSIIFLPLSFDVLKERLKARDWVFNEERFNEWVKWIHKYKDLYDYQVINDDLDKTLLTVKSIFQSILDN